MSYIPSEQSYGMQDRFDLAVAAGLVGGAYSVSKFGAIPSAAASVKADVWDAGGTYVFLTAAQNLTVASTDANDALAGTGARTVELFGLDASYNEITEVVELNGTTCVVTANQFLRCNQMIVRSAGSAETAAGTITAKYLTNTQCQITNGFNQSLMAIWTVPAGKAAIVKYTEASIGRSKEGLFEFKVRPFGEVFQTKKIIKVYEKKSYTHRAFGDVINEKADILMCVTPDTNNSFAEAEFEVLVLDKAIFGIA